jgi:hypothetical protein
MKKVLLISTLIVFGLFRSIQLNAQNLQFNSAAFLEYEGSSDGNSNSNLVPIGILTVANNQIIKITNCGVTLFGCGSADQLSNLAINNKLIGFSGVEFFLPSGTYSIQARDFPSCSGSLKGFISGVIYDIVP